MLAVTFDCGDERARLNFQCAPAERRDDTRAVLEALLEKYADEGIKTIEDLGVLKVQPLDKFGTPVEIIRLFGGRDQYESAVKEMESALYALAK